MVLSKKKMRVSPHNETTTTSQALAFDRYSLTTHPLVLTEGQRRVSVARRQLEVLALLAQANGHVVSGATILDKVWQGAFVDPGSLTQCIFLLRRALGKLRDGSEIIETVARHGYRLAPAALHKNGPASTDRRRSAPIDFSLPRGMAEQDQFRLLVESIDEYAIYMLDRAGRVLTWNAGAEKNKGYRASEILGQHFSRFFPLRM